MTSGVVIAVENDWQSGSKLRGGRYLWIYDPENDLLVYYAHNDRLLAQIGDMVKPGDAIATVGRSGFNAARKRSPTHLHLTVLKFAEGRMVPLNVYGMLQHARIWQEK